jgi:nucleoside-diphosphate-sugar epimerase
MPSIVVTGGSGKAGTEIIRELVTHGYTVMNVDIVPPREQLCHFYKADLCDMGQAVDVIRRAAGTNDRRRAPLGNCDAVIHMAGIPAPGIAPDQVTFQNNLMNTYNMFSAATLFGVKRVVWASSETVFGSPFTRTPPLAAPLTEDHKPEPETGYALAKSLCEQMAREMHRWNPGTTFIGLRISNVLEPHDYAAIPSYAENPDLRKWNMWSWVDVRDVAQACRLSLEANITGAEVFTIAAADTIVPQPNRELLAKAFPSTPVGEAVGTNESLLSIEKAKRVLGYRPKHTWRH